MTRRRLTLLVLATLILGVFASAANAQIPAGRKAPDFTLADLNGNTFKLSSNFVKPGKIVVLDIWATWCPPCKREIPVLIDLNTRYKPKGVVFVGVALDQSKATVAKFAKDQGITYTLLHDPQGEKTGPLYNVKPIPETYIIDKKGVIRYVHVGFGPDDAKKMENEIKALLAQK